MAKSAKIRATLRVDDEAAAAFGTAPSWVGALDTTLNLGEGTTAGTGDILRIANSAGASNTYQIAILARSA